MTEPVSYLLPVEPPRYYRVKPKGLPDGYEMWALRPERGYKVVGDWIVDWRKAKKLKRKGVA